MSNIFISYNPKVQAEQSLAIRLQTLGSIYGLSISLPDRIGAKGLKDTTRERINRASLFIVFSTRSVTKNVVDEINYALSVNKKIIVIYDNSIGKTLNIQGVKEIAYNHKSDNPEKIITEILKEISPPKQQKQTKDENAIGAFILVGLGLLLLAALASEKK